MRYLLIVGILLLSGCTPRLFGYADEKPEFWHQPPMNYDGVTEVDTTCSQDIISGDTNCYSIQE